MKKIILTLWLIFISQFVVLSQPQYFKFTSNTGDNYSIIIDSATINGSSLQIGSEIGVFTPAGLCVGAVVWNGIVPLGLTAWADDSQTPVVDGYTIGDSIFFKIWDSGTNNEYDADASFVTGDGKFGNGAYAQISLSVISSTTESFTIISPNGGENWKVDSEQEIKWTSTNFSGQVKIEYSTDGNATHIEIVASTDNDGSYIWTIPNTPSNNCVIIISDAIDGQPFDISNGVFNITKSGSSNGNIIMVTNTGNSGPGSLRDALTSAGENASLDTIYFSIPETDTSYNSSIGIWTIKPAITLYVPQGTVVDGRIPVTKDSSRPGIEIDGNILKQAGYTGLWLAEGSVLRGLIVSNCQYGIWIQSSKVTVENCYIGTDPTGNLSKGNGIDGILLANGAKNVVIQNNLISGNNNNGIRAFGENTSEDTIRYNFIGTNSTGTSTLFNNNDGINLHAGAHNIVIEKNLISGNKGCGIHLLDSATDGNILKRNFVGTDASGTIPLPNGTFGIALFNGPQDNIIGPDNFVSQNTLDGILIDGSDNFKSTVRNTITANKVTANGRRGIYNFRGGNTELSPPVVNSFVGNAVSGTAGPGQKIEFYADENDEGEVFIGTDTADASGNFYYQLPVQLAPAQNLTATATDSAGNTSEFCQPFKITSAYEMLDRVIPKEFKLYQNYPNPFNPVTKINYSTPQTNFVTIKVYDILGKEVATLVSEKKSAGNYNVNFDASNLSSGVYFYRMKAGSFIDTKKLIVLR